MSRIRLPNNNKPLTPNQAVAIARHVKTIPHIAREIDRVLAADRKSTAPRRKSLKPPPVKIDLNKPVMEQTPEARALLDRLVQVRGTKPEVRNALVVTAKSVKAIDKERARRPVTTSRTEAINTMSNARTKLLALIETLDSVSDLHATNPWQLYAPELAKELGFVCARLRTLIREAEATNVPGREDE